MKANTNLQAVAINMDLNELTYLETRGSLSYYPVVRYFHAKTRGIMDFEGVEKLDSGFTLEFLVEMHDNFEEYRKPKGSKMVKKDDL